MIIFDSELLWLTHITLILISERSEDVLGLQ